LFLASCFVKDLKVYVLFNLEIYGKQLNVYVKDR